MGCTPSHAGPGGADLTFYRGGELGDEDTRYFHANYVLSGRLGKGAFAQVYEARTVCTTRSGEPPDRVVAVKVMDLRSDRTERVHSELEEVDHKRRQSVEREAEFLRSVLPAQRAVRILDFFIEGCLSYTVIERCDRTLLHALEGLPMLTEYTLRPIFRQMMEALAEIHSLQVVHRDLKPDNFLCMAGKVPVVKLCDFGLAIELPPSGGGLTGVYGTPPYMAPEMVSSKGYGAKMDVWSLGVIVYVLFMGQFPYRPAETTGKAMKAAIKAGVPPPSFRPKASSSQPAGGSSSSAVPVAISEDGVRFVRELLQRNPDQRPTADEGLRNRWLSPQGGEDEEHHRSAPSLRCMLHAARRVGAFDPPHRPGKEEEDKSGISQVLAQLQAKHHRIRSNSMKLPRPGVSPSAASTEASQATMSGHSGIEFSAPGTVA